MLAVLCQLVLKAINIKLPTLRLKVRKIVFGCLFFVSLLSLNLISLVEDVPEVLNNQNIALAAFTEGTRNQAPILFDKLKEFRFVVDLYTPTFEQLNYIWGTLGGKSIPSVLYKISILEIESNKVNDIGQSIGEISRILKSKE